MLPSLRGSFSVEKRQFLEFQLLTLQFKCYFYFLLFFIIQMSQLQLHLCFNVLFLHVDLVVYLYFLWILVPESSTGMKCDDFPVNSYARSVRIANISAVGHLLF